MKRNTRYKLYRVSAIIVFSLAIIPAFTGCIGMYQPKSYIEVTRPPMRVIYLDYHRDIKAEDVKMIMNNMNKGKYYPYRFNDTNDINVNYDAGLVTKHSKKLEIKK